MTFFWSTIFPALLAGGLAGQLLTVFGGAWLTQGREQRRWLISERHKCFVELLSLVTRIPKTEDDRNQWTYKIRDCSQRIHILFDGGTAPKDLSDSLELIFQLARERKNGNLSDDWSLKQRESVRNMRKFMSTALFSK